jgi:antitoxin CcdA
MRMAKTAVNLSVSEVILREARALKLNLSQVFEEGLREHLRRKRAEKWQEENRDALRAYNERVERDGPFNKDLLSF